MDGFPAVSSIGLPALRELFTEKKGTNEIYIETLLRLMAGVEDTNILSRSDRQTLYYAQQAAQDILQRAGPLRKKDLLPYGSSTMILWPVTSVLAAVRTCSSYPSSFTVWSLFFQGLST